MSSPLPFGPGIGRREPRQRREPRVRPRRSTGLPEKIGLGGGIRTPGEPAPAPDFKSGGWFRRIWLLS